MARLEPMQQTFAGGEISPRLRGLVESEVYAKALALCQDWEVLPQGNLRCRFGTRFADFGDTGIIRSIPSPGRQGYLARFANYNVQLRSADGLYYSAGNIPAGATDLELVTNGLFTSVTDASHAPGWSTSGTVDFLHFHATSNNAIQCVGVGWASNNASGTLTQSFSAPAGRHQLRFSLLACHGYGSPSLPQPAIQSGATFEFKVGTSPNGNDLYDTSITAGSNWNNSEDAAFLIDITLASAATVYLTITSTTGLTTLSGISFQSGVGYIQLATPYTVAQLADVRCVVRQDVEGLVVLHPDVPPYEIYVDTLGQWHCDEITFTNAPLEWVAQSWPSCGEWFQGRLWLGGAEGSPTGIWASTIGTPFDFTLPGTPTDTSALAYKLAVKGAVRWMRGHQQVLLVGTDMGEQVVSSQGGVVCTTDINIREESRFGGSGVEPLAAGSTIVFASADERKLRAVEFDWQTQGRKAIDFSFLAEHLTAAGVTELAFARDPDQLVVALLADGTCAVATLTAESVAWWRLAPSGGGVLSMCTTEAPTGSVLWLLNQSNDTSGPDDIVIEMLQFSESATQMHMDHWVQRSLSASATIQNLPINYSEHPTVIIDGQLVACPNAIDSSGNLLLPQSYTSTNVFVGWSFYDQVQTLPMAAKGVGQCSKRRWARILARLRNSGLPMLNGDLASDTNPMHSQDYMSQMDRDAIAFTLGWDQGQVTIQRSGPVRTEIESLFGVAGFAEV